MQFLLNPEIEGLSQFFFIFPYDDMIVLIFEFIEVALRSDRLILIVNLNDSGEQQRFTLARELGHHVMDVVGRIDAEKASQRFAGAFLMPADALMNEIGKRRASISIMALIYVKKLFGVSIQAIALRCRDLGIIGNRFFRSLLREFHRLGWRNPPYVEPASRMKEIPTRFKRLTLRALSENVLTDSKAAELLGVRVLEIDDLMDAGLGSEVEACVASGRDGMRVMVSDTSVLIDLEAATYWKSDSRRDG